MKREMHLERWSDTAFGTDYGADFLAFIEHVTPSTVTLPALFARCDLERFLREPSLLEGRTDNDIRLRDPEVERGSAYAEPLQFVHYEDAVIALSAIAAECEANGFAELSRASGTRRLSAELADDELALLTGALRGIHDHPERFVLFEMCPGAAGEAVLEDLRDILRVLDEAIARRSAQGR